METEAFETRVLLASWYREQAERAGIRLFGKRASAPQKDLECEADRLEVHRNRR